MKAQHKADMVRVSEVTVRWLSGQIEDADAVETILDILLPDVPVTCHAATDEDIEEHIANVFDEVPYERAYFMVPMEVM